jgi:hypothetical protein
VIQLCAEAGAVVTTGTEVGVGDTVTTGGLPEVHPLTIIRPAVTIRRMNNKPEVFPAMVSDFAGNMIIIWLDLTDFLAVQEVQKKLQWSRGFPPHLFCSPQMRCNRLDTTVIITISAEAERGDKHCPLLHSTCTIFSNLHQRNSTGQIFFYHIVAGERLQK